MSSRFRVIILWLVIIGIASVAWWKPGFGQWLTHDGFPLIFGTLGIFAVIAAIYSAIRLHHWSMAALGNLMIGIGSLALAFGYVIGQSFPVLGFVIIVGGIIPWAYGLWYCKAGNAC